MKFSKYYYENFSIDTSFDNLNPRYVLALDGVDEILTKIVNADPFTISIEEMKENKIVEKLLYIDVLREKEGKLGLAVPVFIENEIDILKSLSCDVAGIISEILIENKDRIEAIISKIHNGFSNERNLYHILCGSIFDGKIFDFLEEKSLVTTSKEHKSGLDYLIILYEQAERLDNYSKKLLCSYNRLISNDSGFVSFGDSDGVRKDFYRYFRLNELNELKEEEMNYIRYEPEDLVEKFDHLLSGTEVEEEYLQIFEYFNYIRDGEICVPVYDKYVDAVIDELYDCILDMIEEPLVKALRKIEQRKDLLSISHGVSVKDISNEIYHIIFGEINELLVKNNIVAKPEYIAGEGRYLKSFETQLHLKCKK